MASYRIIAWKDIPATVEARDDADHVTMPLSDRFQALIDSLAMQLGLGDEDAYLEHWTATDGERPGSAREVGSAGRRRWARAPAARLARRGRPRLFNRG